MFAAVVFTLVGTVMVAVLVGSEIGDGRLRPVAKSAASACFVATALAAGALDAAYGTWVLVALVLSAVGDVALLGSSSATFLGGLVSFLLGHVAFAVGFTVRGLDVAVVLVALAVLAVPFVIVVRWLLPHAGALRGPVVAYSLVISTMVAVAAGTVGAEGDVRILIGALAFYVSDLAVARDRFVAPGVGNRLWGLPLYYGAQFLLAWTVVA